mmetsp:Transcript_28546/g.63949  ORF Transcript_28546/g.63949 Transcript_28546/m.63949 type:complete len:382 (+) Transcript_28546:1221-2366(+)
MHNLAHLRDRCRSCHSRVSFDGRCHRDVKRPREMLVDCSELQTEGRGDVDPLPVKRLHEIPNGRRYALTLPPGLGLRLGKRPELPADLDGRGTRRGVHPAHVPEHDPEVVLRVQVGQRDREEAAVPEAEPVAEQARQKRGARGRVVLGGPLRARHGAEVDRLPHGQDVDRVPGGPAGRHGRRAPGADPHPSQQVVACLLGVGFEQLAPDGFHQVHGAKGRVRGNHDLKPRAIAQPLEPFGYGRRELLHHPLVPVRREREQQHVAARPDEVPRRAGDAHLEPPLDRARGPDGEAPAVRLPLPRPASRGGVDHRRVAPAAEEARRPEGDRPGADYPDPRGRDPGTAVRWTGRRGRGRRRRPDRPPPPSTSEIGALLEAAGSVC